MYVYRMCMTTEEVRCMVRWYTYEYMYLVGVIYLYHPGTSLSLVCTSTLHGGMAGVGAPMLC